MLNLLNFQQKIIIICITYWKVSQFQRCSKHTHSEKSINFANHEDIGVEFETVFEPSPPKTYRVFFVFPISFHNSFLSFLWLPKANFGPRQRRSLSNPMVITHSELQIRLEVCREPRNDVGSISPVERPAGFERGAFR